MYINVYIKDRLNEISDIDNYVFHLYREFIYLENLKSYDVPDESVKYFQLLHNPVLTSEDVDEIHNALDEKFDYLVNYKLFETKVIQEFVKIKNYIESSDINDAMIQNWYKNQLLLLWKNISQHIIPMTCEFKVHRRLNNSNTQTLYRFYNSWLTCYISLYVEYIYPYRPALLFIND